jgi:rod shape-determining protein MreC
MQVYLKKQNFFFRRAIMKTSVLILAIGALNMFQLQAKNLFYGASSPVSAALWQASEGVSRGFQPFLNVKKLQSDNAALQAENQKLIYQVFMLKQSNLEHQEYQNALQNAVPSSLSIKAAQITGLDITNDKATINKGSADGVAENTAVISGQNILYGKVTTVYKNFSEVTLISNKGSVVDVKVIGAGDEKNFIYGAIKGTGALGFSLDLVDSNAEIQEGQSLVTSGLDGIFPAGLLVGSITAVNKNDLKPFQTASVKPLGDPRSIETVFVVTKK